MYRPRRKKAHRPPSAAERAAAALEIRERRRRQLRKWKRLAIYASAILFAILCWRGLSSFQLRPLDSPGTLHYLLWPAFAAFLRRYQTQGAAQAAWLRWSLIATLAPLALAMMSFVASRFLPQWKGRMRRILCSHWLFLLSVAVCLLICRFPLILGSGANIDEGESISAAMKLFRDPVFFRAIDTHTFGPLNIYPLMWPAAAGLSPDFSSTRVFALAVIFLTLYVLYRAILTAVEDDLVRLAILPALVFFATAANGDLWDANAEHVPMLLVASALLAASYVIATPERYTWPLAALGVLGTAAFFAKMQAAPIIAAVALVAACRVWTNGNEKRLWRPAVVLALGAAPLLVLNLLVCLVTGVWRDFWIAYVITNLRYSGGGFHLFSEANVFASYLISTPETAFLFGGVVVLLVISAGRGLLESKGLAARAAEAAGFATAAAAGILTFVVRQPSPAAAFWLTLTTLVLLAAADFLTSRRLGWLGALASVAALASIYSVYAPQRRAPHYLLLLVIPAGMCIGWLVFRGRQPKWSAVLLGGAALTFVSAQAVALHPRTAANFGFANPNLRLEAASLLADLTPFDGGIMIWGWRPDIYVATGRVPATRDTHILYLLSHDPEIGGFYRDRFLRDMRRHPADLFADARAISCCLNMTLPEEDFERLPDIAAYIHRHYVPVGSRFQMRIYMRRDLAQLGTPWPCSTAAITCLPSIGWERAAPLRPIPSNVHINLEFTPLAGSEPGAFVLGVSSAKPEGFQLRHVSNNLYRLAVGTGAEWELSRYMLIPAGRHVSLSIDIAGTDVSIHAGAEELADMKLTRPMADSVAPILLGSPPDGPQFMGAFASLEIR